MLCSLARRAVAVLAPVAAILSSSSCAGPSSPGMQSAEPQRLVAVVQERLPFDPTSFTQGLEVAPDGTLVVGTGQWGESRIYRRTLGGEVVASQNIDPAFFGEGITLVDDTIWQLTWQDGVAMRRDLGSLEEVGRASYSGEGWGLCFLEGSRELMLSDGTSTLRRLDPDTFAPLGSVAVRLGGQPVEGLNELECVGGDVYANVFTTTDILRIDAATGAVTAVIDASSLPNNAARDPNNVLNGIAHIPGSAGAGRGAGAGEFYLAGKRWPDLYRVTFEPAN